MTQWQQTTTFTYTGKTNQCLLLFPSWDHFLHLHKFSWVREDTCVISVNVRCLIFKTRLLCISITFIAVIWFIVCFLYVYYVIEWRQCLERDFHDKPSHDHCISIDLIYIRFTIFFFNLKIVCRYAEQINKLKFFLWVLYYLHEMQWWNNEIIFNVLVSLIWYR